jgi:hypothetical protein
MTYVDEGQIEHLQPTRGDIIIQSQPLTEEQLKDIPKKPGVYRIFSGDETLLCIGSSENDVRHALRYFLQCVQPPFTPRWRDTQAITYVNQRLYNDRYPREQLQFDYQLTSTRDEAPQLKHTWLQEYFEQHGRLPPLSTRM